MHFFARGLVDTRHRKQVQNSLVQAGGFVGFAMFAFSLRMSFSLRWALIPFTLQMQMQFFDKHVSPKCRHVALLTEKKPQFIDSQFRQQNTTREPTEHRLQTHVSKFNNSISFITVFTHIRYAAHTHTHTRGKVRSQSCTVNAFVKNGFPASLLEYQANYRFQALKLEFPWY